MTTAAPIRDDARAAGGPLGARPTMWTSPRPRPGSATTGTDRSTRSLRTPDAASAGGAACPQLTGREWQVLGLLAQSLAVEEVAERLGITAWTVEERRLRALAKLAGARGHDASVLRRTLGDEA